MKLLDFCCKLILSGVALMLAGFVCTIIAIPTEELIFWKIAGWTWPLGILAFFTGEHLRSKELKRPPTK